MDKFSPAAQENLQHYVYFLQDPDTEKVFYVGKGKDDRVFHHLEEKVEKDTEKEKIARIQKIKNSGHDVQISILRHGLKKKEALKIEAAMIDMNDFRGKYNLLNLQRGHDSLEFGLKTVEEISEMYDSEPLETKQPIILLNLRQSFRRGMTAEELYYVTRQSWKVALNKDQTARAQIAKYAVATCWGFDPRGL